MKLLWITTECPYPANTGGRIGVWRRIVELSKNNDIFLYTIIDNENEKDNESEILKYCKEIHFFKRQGVTPFFLLKCLFMPFPAISRWNGAMKKQIDLRCIHEFIDYVIVDFPQMAGVLSERVKGNQRIVLNQHNIEYLALRSITTSIHDPLKRMVYIYVSIQMKWYEERIYKRSYVHLYTFVSSKDLEYFSMKYGRHNTYLLPVGTDIKEMPVEIEDKSANIVFVGKMSYIPNVEGAIWFLNNCWKRIQERVPDARFYVVGKDPTEELKNACAEMTGVFVTGTVTSVEEYYRKASLVIIPLLSGGGVKVKLLEALGYGKLVISTSKGVEGTDFKNKEHLIVEDNPEKFSKYCIDVLDHSEKYGYIQEAALKKVRDQYSWESVIGCFENFLQKDIKENRTDR